mgnify:CR=1 FL=1
MLGALRKWWRERQALRAAQAALAAGSSLPQSLSAVRVLGECGGKRAIEPLCSAFSRGPEAVSIEALAALSKVYSRCPDARVLKLVNEAILSERQSPPVREAAIAALAEQVDARHAGSLLEVLKAQRTPLRVRQAAFHALWRLGYAELVECLAETYLRYRKTADGAALREWVVERLRALDDREKLTKLNEIVHGRRKLRHYAVNFESDDPAVLIHLMVDTDPYQAPRFLGHMADHATTVISRAAAEALSQVRVKQREADARRPSAEALGSHGPRHGTGHGTGHGAGHGTGRGARPGTAPGTGHGTRRAPR